MARKHTGGVGKGRPRLLPPAPAFYIHIYICSADIATPVVGDKIIYAIHPLFGQKMEEGGQFIP
jgi:hypothetical protein